jgi:hypothetical protein
MLIRNQKPILIQILVSPVLAQTPVEMDLIEGNDLILSCIILMGNPKPTTKWYKNGVEIDQKMDGHTKVSQFSLLLYAFRLGPKRRFSSFAQRSDRTTRRIHLQSN